MLQTSKARGGQTAKADTARRAAAAAQGRFSGTQADAEYRMAGQMAMW
jgi:hypothetical protein